MLSLAQNLRQILSRPTCVVGVGNTFRNDDAAGVMVAEGFASDLPSSGHLNVINAEDVIENFVFRIADSSAENVLIVDAVDGTEGEPGSLVLGELEVLEKVQGGFSTHKLALSTAGSVLRHHGKKVYLLGILVGNTDYGTDVSQEIRESTEAVIALLRQNSKE